MIVYSRATTFRTPVFGDALLTLKSLCELCWLPLLIVRPLQKKKREKLISLIMLDGMTMKHCMQLRNLAVISRHSVDLCAFYGQ